MVRTTDVRLYAADTLRTTVRIRSQGVELPELRVTVEGRSGPHGLPPELTGKISPCGAIVVWTRTGRR